MNVLSQIDDYTGRSIGDDGVKGGADGCDAGDVELAADPDGGYAGRVGGSFERTAGLI